VVWTITIPNWCPPSVNKSRGRHFSKGHKLTREVVEYLTSYNATANVPKIRPDYRPVRRVSLIVRKKHPLPDPDNLLKHFLDGLKGAGLIVVDRNEWCHWQRPHVYDPSDVEKTYFTLVIIEDVPANIEELKAEAEERRRPTKGKKIKIKNPFAHEF
jgi:hypothetical protein